MSEEEDNYYEGLGVRTVYIMSNRMPKFSKEDINGMSDHELRVIRNLGPKMLKELRRWANGGTIAAPSVEVFLKLRLRSGVLELTEDEAMELGSALKKRGYVQ